MVKRIISNQEQIIVLAEKNPALVAIGLSERKYSLPKKQKAWPGMWQG